MLLGISLGVSLTPCYRLLVNDDIDAIIARGEERTSELNSKYESLNFDDLSNFKSEASVREWEGEDFRNGVRVSKLLHPWAHSYTFRLAVIVEVTRSESSVTQQAGAEI